MKVKKALLPLLISSLAALITLPLVATTIKLDPLHQHQYFRGFGTCLVPWTGSMVDLYERESFQRIYAQEMNLNLLRVDAMPYVHPEVSHPDDISYENFNITSGGQQHANNSRMKVFLDFAKAIHQLNDETQVIITVWSFPDWMKTNNSHLNGGDIRTNRREHAAALLVEYVKLFQSEGVPVLAVSFANEPQFAQFYNSQVIEPESYAEVLAILGRRLEEAGLGDVMIYGPEHMTHDFVTNNQYSNAIIRHDEAWKYMDAFASHGYTDGVVSDPRSTASARLWDRVISRNGWEFWVTEGGTGNHTYNDSLDELAFMLHHLLVESFVSLYTPWQITGSDLSGHNLMQNDRYTAKTRAFQHYSTVVHPGMTRVHAETEDDVRVTAFADREAGKMGIVLLNTENQARSIDLQIPYVSTSGFSVRQTTSNSAYQGMADANLINGSVSLSLPARSIMSLYADDIDFTVLPAFSLNGDSAELRIPGNAGEVTIDLMVEDDNYAWNASMRTGQWVRLQEDSTSGMGNSTLNLFFFDNPNDVERVETLTVNGLQVTIIQELYVEPVISWWNDITPDPSSGARDTALLFGNYAGIGWIYDEFWPFAYSFSMGSWIWAVEEGGSASSFFAYDFGTAQWVWISGDMGIAYLFTDEDWLNLNE